MNVGRTQRVRDPPDRRRRDANFTGNNGSLTGGVSAGGTIA